MQKILVVEDNWELNQGICYALKQEGFATVGVHTMNEAKAAFTENVDLVLLDINLPDGNGFTFCQWMKKRNNTAILFLTARDLEEDILKGYELGAEDYVTKPFSMKVLLKKINVILNREPGQRFSVFDDGFLAVNFDTAKVQVNGQECLLTPTEFRLLHCLAAHSGQLLTYSILLEQLWDKDGQFVDKHTLAVNVNRLRGKIEDQQHKYISNVYGMGYQWLEL